MFEVHLGYLQHCFGMPFGTRTAEANTSKLTKTFMQQQDPTVQKPLGTPW